MTFSFTDYIPHAALTALATITAYVFKSHDDRDNTRFGQVGDGMQELSKKLDTAIMRQADNHAQILQILLDQKHDK
jgi:hypothetical protein